MRLFNWSVLYSRMWLIWDEFAVCRNESSIFCLISPCKNIGNNISWQKSVNPRMHKCGVYTLCKCIWCVFPHLCAWTMNHSNPNKYIDGKCDRPGNVPCPGEDFHMFVGKNNKQMSPKLRKIGYVSRKNVWRSHTRSCVERCKRTKCIALHLALFFNLTKRFCGIHNDLVGFHEISVFPLI